MNRKGSAILIAVGIVGVISVLSTAYVVRIINENSTALRNLYSSQAFWISEAGIQKAAWDYNNNSCQGMRNAGTGVSCLSCVSCGLGIKSYTGTLGSGRYTVSVDTDTKTYVSTGMVTKGTGMTEKILATRKIKMFFGRDYIFGFAAFSQGTLTLNNNSLIDSYNSTTAAYNSSSANLNGNVGTNGSTVNVIEIGNNSTIKGGVSTGPGGTVDYKPSKVTITNGITHTNDVYIEPVSVPASLQSATYFGATTVSTTLNLSTGLYRYDSISIGNNGTLNINGNVQLYLTNEATSLTTGNNTVAINISSGGSLVIYSEGVIDFGNSVTISNNTTNHSTKNFQIYSLYDGANGVVIDNNNDFYGAVYAPLTDVVISNNAAFYGSAIGETVTVSNNGLIHYDEALSQTQAPWQPSEPRDWQEQFN